MYINNISTFLLQYDNFTKVDFLNVLKYANEWEQIMGRLGRWINFKEKY